MFLWNLHFTVYFQKIPIHGCKNDLQNTMQNIFEQLFEYTKKVEYLTMFSINKFISLEKFIN